MMLRDIVLFHMNVVEGYHTIVSSRLEMTFLVKWNYHWAPYQLVMSYLLGFIPSEG